MKRTALAIVVFLAAAGCADNPDPHADLVELYEVFSAGEGLQFTSQYSMFADRAEFQPDGSLLLTGVSFRRQEDPPDDPAATADSARFWFEGDEPHATIGVIHSEVTIEDMEAGNPKGLLLLKEILSSQPSDAADEAAND